MRKGLSFALLLLAGCSSVPMLPSLKPYKIDIQQGNYITQEMVARLKPGMTRNQVRFILGTPLVADPFHANRWDYVYLFWHAGKLEAERHITVIFEGNKLTRIEGDVVPARGTKKEASAGGDAPAGKGSAGTGKEPRTDAGKQSQQ